MILSIRSINETKKTTNFDILTRLLKNTPDDIMNYIISVFKETLKNDGEDGWNLLMKYDSLSTREFLSQ